MESRIAQIEELTGGTCSGIGRYDSMLSAVLYNNNYAFTADKFPVAYKQFLKKYGWLEVTQETDVRWLIGSYDDLDMNQDAFRKQCRRWNHINEEQVKYCWVIARAGHYTNYTYYYFDFSSEGKGFVFSINSGGKKMFADDFLGFLDRIIIGEDRHSELLYEKECAYEYNHEYDYD